jgi:hypothetical protein
MLKINNSQDNSNLEWDNLSKLYSELKETKPSLYKRLNCYGNTLSFLSYLEKKYFFIKSNLKNELFVIYFHNEANGTSPYGTEKFGFHFNLLYADSKSSNWYILDYDIENISKCKHQLEDPILASSYLKKAFSNHHMRWALKLARDKGNYYPLTSAQQIMLFSLQEFRDVVAKYPDLPLLLEFCSLDAKQPENIVINLYRNFGISFNNLYEFFQFLDKRPQLITNPSDSLQELRKYYRDKPLATLTQEGFSNSKDRLSHIELNKLITSFSQSVELKQGIELREPEVLIEKTSRSNSSFFKISREQINWQADSCQKSFQSTP